MELHIPLEIPSQNKTNKGLNYWVRAAATKRTRRLWAEHCRIAMLRGGIPRATGKRRMHVLAYRKRKCYDIENLIGGAKACVDGIVDAGLLVDDRIKMATITYAQELASKSPTGKPHTVIFVREI